VAHEGLTSATCLGRLVLVVTLSVALAACADAAPAPSSPRAFPVNGTAPGEFPDEPRALLRYRSVRFHLSIPLPDGRAWTIDDHTTSLLVARHPPTRSTLSVGTFTEPQLVNRQKCEERAREQGLVTLRDPRTLEDQAIIGPDAYDSRLWVALEAGASAERPLMGHVLLFGAFVRKCLFAHYATEVASERDEPLLTSRLAVARLRILAGIEVLPFDQPPRIDEGGSRVGAKPP
jgi:hypothetical protein